MPTTLLQADLPGLDLIHRGKVRDVYALPPAQLADGSSTGERLLIVATDRLSAFDVVLPDPIPGKGEMLTQISNFWFDKTAHIVPNHLLHTPLAEVLPPGIDPALYAQRAVVTRRLKPVPVEAIDITTDTGWKMVLDRGLDIFQPTPRKMNGFSLGERMQEHRMVRGFYVTYVENL